MTEAMTAKPRKLTYNAAIFAAPDLEAAKRIILTPADDDTETRWRRETPYLADLLGRALELGPGRTVIDYGCGVGRLSKALIEGFGCWVVGVDVSPEMRALAPGYVGSPGFRVVSRPELKALAEQGLAADAAIGVWVLQHCAAPRDDVGLIAAALRPGGRLGLVNTKVRCVPTAEAGWVDDRIDIRAPIAERFDTVSEGDLDPAQVGRDVAGFAFWGVYARRPDPPTTEQETAR